MAWLAVASAFVPPTSLTTFALITSQTFTTVRSSGSRCRRSSSLARVAASALWSVTFVPFGEGCIDPLSTGSGRCGRPRGSGQHARDGEELLGVRESRERHEHGPDTVLGEPCVPLAL